MKNEFITNEINAYLRQNIKSEEDKEEFEKNKDENMKKIEAAALSKVKHFLILRAIAEKENIKVNSQELANEQDAICKAYNLSPANLKKGRSEELQNYLVSMLMVRKVLDFLFKKNVKSSGKNEENGDK